MAGNKDSRFEARLNAEQDELLAWAAEQLGTTKSAFVLGTALERARAMRERERVTRISLEKVEDFLDALDNAAPRVAEALDVEPFEHR